MLLEKGFIPKEAEMPAEINFNGEAYSVQNLYSSVGLNNPSYSIEQKFAAVVPIFFDFRNYSISFAGEDISNVIGYSRDEINEIGFQKLVINMKRVSMRDSLLSLIPEEHGNDFFQTEYKLKNKFGGQSIVLEFAKKIKTDAGMFVGHIGFWQFR